jgi:hypothetical protein
MEDPLYVREFLPLAAWGHVHEGRGDESFTAAGSGTEHREKVLADVRAVRDRTFRYEAQGPFGRAVDRAREQARWGATEAAGDTLVAALGAWEPYGDEHLAPVGLFADPILGPVITPERGREILETPRAAGLGRRHEESPVPAPAPGPDGLTWLVDEEREQDEEQEREHGPEDLGPDSAPDRQRDQPRDQEPRFERPRASYRFVLAHGLSPRELAGRIGQGSLLAPAGRRELRGLRSEGSALFRVGAAGEEWSFAFEEDAEPFPRARGQLSASEEPASRGTRSVTVWCEPGSGSASPGVFHFSYAEDGERAYGFTVRGGETLRWGAIPEALDPRGLFPAASEDGAADDTTDDTAGSAADGGVLDPDDEYEALTAVAEAFGVSLPYFAITHGRLHAVVADSWIRPAGPEEPRLSTTGLTR